MSAGMSSPFVGRGAAQELHRREEGRRVGHAAGGVRLGEVEGDHVRDGQAVVTKKDRMSIVRSEQTT